MDQDIFWLIHNLAGRNQLLDWAGIFWAKYALYALLFGAALWAVAGRKDLRSRIRVAGTALAAAFISRFALTELIRWILPRPRPYVYFDFAPMIAEPLLQSSSFPSGHAAFLFAFVVALALLLRLSLSWSLLWFASAALVGIARIFVGVHWPSDIFGGAILGAGVGFLSVAAWRRFKARSK